MEPNGPPNTPGLPSSGDLIQQRKDAVQAAAQSGDGSFLSQFSNNPFFTAVSWAIFEAGKGCITDCMGGIGIWSRRSRSGIEFRAERRPTWRCAPSKTDARGRRNQHQGRFISVVPSLDDIISTISTSIGSNSCWQDYFHRLATPTIDTRDAPSLYPNAKGRTLEWSHAHTFCAGTGTWETRFAV